MGQGGGGGGGGWYKELTCLPAGGLGRVALRKEADKEKLSVIWWSIFGSETLNWKCKENAHVTHSEASVSTRTNMITIIITLINVLSWCDL